jgi:hypothetical protein
MSRGDDSSSRLGVMVMGAILVGVGMLFMVINLVPGLSMGRLWPLFMVIPVAILAAAWIQDGEKANGVVFPIVLLLFYCGYFLWLNLTSWHQVAFTWPNFLIGPGLGFLGLYLVQRKWEYLVPASVLLVLAAIFYAALMENTWFIGFTLVAVGILFILKPLLSKGENGKPEGGD